MYKQNILCSFTTRKQLRKGKEKKDRSINVTREDGLKLVQYNVTKYTNLFTFLSSCLVYCPRRIPAQRPGPEEGT